jgi:hypothetical protein
MVYRSGTSTFRDVDTFLWSVPLESNEIERVIIFI